MRFRHRDGTLVHLAYCTNVHQAEDLDGVLAQLARYAEPVRDRLGVDRLGLGLWLARPVATELLDDPSALPKLRAELAARGLEVVTLNGFPYQGFKDRLSSRRVALLGHVCDHLLHLLRAELPWTRCQRAGLRKRLDQGRSVAACRANGADAELGHVRG